MRGTEGMNNTALDVSGPMTKRANDTRDKFVEA